MTRYLINAESGLFATVTVVLLVVTRTRLLSALRRTVILGLTPIIYFRMLAVTPAGCGVNHTVFVALCSTGMLYFSLINLLGSDKLNRIIGAFGVAISLYCCVQVYLGT
jgi:hypothetical protein